MANQKAAKTMGEQLEECKKFSNEQLAKFCKQIKNRKGATKEDKLFRAAAQWTLQGRIGADAAIAMIG